MTILIGLYIAPKDKNAWNYISNFSYCFIQWCLRNKDKFTLLTLHCIIIIIIIYLFIYYVVRALCGSQWPRGLRRGSAAARLLGLQVQISPGARTSVSCKCCVLSGGVFSMGQSLVQRSPTECDCEASTMRSLWFTRTTGDMKITYQS
jgi:hypothetical protein